MATARVGSVKAADPGLGFTLNFDSPLNSTLKVAITMTDLQTNQNYQSEVTLFNSISDKELVFVVPFGDDAYAPSNCLKFNLDLYSPHDASSSQQNIKGVVFGENGVFNFSTSVPTSLNAMPKTGDMLQSADGKYIGIYQQNGNFCVYPQFSIGQGENFPPVFTSNSAVNQATYFNLSAAEGFAYIYIFPTGGSPQKAVSRSNILASMQWQDTKITINSNGALCFNDQLLTFTAQ